MMDVPSREEESPNGMVYVQDCREADGAQVKISKSEARTYANLQLQLREKLTINDDDTFIITTTNREEINGDETWKCIQDEETIYVLKSIDQELVTQARERVNFLPHYDTIVKGGMYEYYASEGHNPLPYAFAELIDNALAATVENSGPRKIEIRLILEEDNINKNMIIFLDNGKGMTSRQLNNWAIYRLSKFIRRESKGLLKSVENGDESERPSSPITTNAVPRSLNSDISYFGVGGKQAIFFIGNSTRMISKPKGYPDVHELTISKEEFEQKEKNKEAIYSGWIRNRKPGDNSHIKDDDEILKKLISEESTCESFTAVIINGINPSHVSYLRSHVSEWTRQLAHIYHFYIHGPAGNVAKAGSTSTENLKENEFSKINVEVMFYNRLKDQIGKVINLKDITDDLQTLFIRTSSNNFDFKASVEGTGIVEGVLRYHPFLYDTETYPTNAPEAATDGDGDEEIEDGFSGDLRQARGKRSIFECYWNGRLIPYTTIEEFEWCSTPKKSKQIPFECFNRVSGVLWTNDKFQVSTNKLTFIDLEMKLRDKNTTYTRLIPKESKKSGKRTVAADATMQEKRTDISREFMNWLKDCHEQCDKQIKFCGYKETITRIDLPRNRQGPWTVFGEIEWDNRIFRKGNLVRITRVVPSVYGTIERFLLFGEYTGDIYATGGEVEVHMEPRSLYDDVKVFPLGKLDRVATNQQIKKYINDEEAKLPDRLVVTWPNADEIKSSGKYPAGSTIGDMKIEILNHKGELISKLPGSKQKKLLVELKVTYHGDCGDQLIAQHISQHGKTWPYWFHKMENIKGIGPYTLKLQVVVNESGALMVAGHELPSVTIKFDITEAEPQKFSIGFLEGPFRIGTPFQIPLEFQDEYGHSTKPSSNLSPELTASGLELKYGEKQIKGNSLILKDIIAFGSVSNGLGKNFNLIVKVPGLSCDSNTLKIRLLPGVPATFLVSPDEQLTIENGDTIKYQIEVRDEAGNQTSSSKMSVVCKFFGVGGGLSPVTVECSNSIVTMSKIINIQKMKGEIVVTTKFEPMGVFKSIQSVERSFKVLPSQRPSSLEVIYSENGEDISIKQGHDVTGVCGEAIKGLTFIMRNEAGVKMKINDDLASKIKVNWTPKLSRDAVMSGRLPDIKVSTLVTETKYCQVSFTDGATVTFGFNVKGVAGDANQIKCILSGSNKVRLGEKLQADILVLVKDAHGNEIKKFEKGVLKDLEISCEGLIVSETVRMLGQSSGFNIHNITFESGRLGRRELRVKLGTLEDYVCLEIVAGPPAKLTLPEWDLTQPTIIYNGGQLPQELTVQLCDEADNPTAEENVRIDLIRDSSIKLVPQVQRIKTDKKGFANFGILSITGKNGLYELQCKAFINRSILLGPSLLISIQPDATKPVSISIEYEKTAKCIVGEILPDFQVTILSETKSAMVSAKASSLNMKIWKADEGSRPSALALTFVPDRNSSSNEGRFYFRKRRAPELNGQYNIQFNYNDDKHKMTSDLICVEIMPGIPIQLGPLQPPGMPSVSNGKNAASRYLIRNMQLVLKDRFENATGFDKKGTILLELLNSCESSETPLLVGHTNRLQMNLLKGVALVQNIRIEENSPGTDGQTYTLRCSVQLDEPHNIPPYDVPFSFYNDLKKQSEMASLSKERDELLETLNMYQMIFDTSKQLIDELKGMLKDCQSEEYKVKMELRKLGIDESQISQLALDNTLQKKLMEKQQLLRKPRRMCGLSEARNDPEVLGKIGYLAKVADIDITRVLSWHMSADMDCIVTLTTKKAKEIYQMSQGKQQVLPLDSIYRKALPEWNKSLPHVKMRPNWNPRGNPEYARNTLHFTSEHEDSCRLVFGMLLGDTLILDSLDDASSYRQEIVKFTHCPTILTRSGDRIRSNGKFGGLMNKALSIEKLRGSVFGEPMPPAYDSICREIDFLEKYKSSIDKRKSVELDLNEQLHSLNKPDMKAKQREYREAEERMKKIEAELGVVCSSSRSSLNSSLPALLSSMTTTTVKEQPKNLETFVQLESITPSPSPRKRGRPALSRSPALLRSPRGKRGRRS